MNLQELINSMTMLDKTKQTKNILWSEVIKNNKDVQSISGKGEIPFDLENYSNNFPNISNNNKNSRNKIVGDDDDSCSENESENELPKQYDFHEIENSLRMINELNCQSNEMIEKRYRERQNEILKKNKMKNEKSHTTNMSLSSQALSSQKSNIQNLTSSKDLSKKHQVLENISSKRYEKNALIAGLLKHTEEDYANIELTKPNEDFLNFSELTNDEVSILDTKVEEQNMYKYRIGTLLKSNDDEDVYYHPLMEEIKKDSEWQNLYLQRKGKETLQSSRQFYMNIDDSSFTFQPSSSKS